MTESRRKKHPMPRTATPVASDIPRWPATSVLLNADGSGRLTIDGRVEDLAAGDLTASRAHVIQRVVDTADGLGRPVRLTTTDPDGEWELAIHPDGQVEELAARPAAEPLAAPVAPAPPASASAASTPPPPPPIPAPPPPDVFAHDDIDLPARAETRRVERAPRTPRPARPATSRTSRRTAARLGAALALLVAIASAVAIIVTSGPDTVVEQTPAARTDARAAAAPGEITKAINDARRNSQQRMADQRRRDDARANAAAKRADDRRLARAKRALRRRVAARNASRRRAPARRAGARQPGPTTAARPQPRVSAPPPPPPAARVSPPPPPPSPPPARQCGEFDIC